MTTTAELDALIEELTVDAYNDEEQLSGFLVGAEEALVRGEHAKIAGAVVKVIRVDRGPDVRTGCARDARCGQARRRARRLQVRAGQRARGRGRRLPALAGAMSRPVPVPSALKVLSDAEKAAILDELAAADPDVAGRAERGAVALAEVEADDVANGVTAALLALDQDDLAPPPGARATGTSNRPKRRGRCSRQPSSRGLKTSRGRRALALPKPRASLPSSFERSVASMGTSATTTV